MQELFTIEQCKAIADKKNWESVTNNPYYAIQFDCFHKDRTL